MKRDYRLNISFSRILHILKYIFLQIIICFFPSVDIQRFLEDNLLGVHFSSFSTVFSPIKSCNAVCGKVAGQTIKVIPITHPARYCFVNVNGAGSSHIRVASTHKYTRINVLHSHVRHLALLAIRRIFRRDHIWDRKVVSRNPQCNHVRSSSFLGCSEPRAQSICQEM